MNRPAWAGTEARVSRETTTIVRNDAGTRPGGGLAEQGRGPAGGRRDGQRPGDGGAGAQPAHQQPGHRAGRRQPAPPDPQHQQRREGRGGHGEGQAHGPRHRDVLGRQRQQQRDDDRDRRRDAEGRDPAEAVGPPASAGHVLRQHARHRDGQARAGREEGREGARGDQPGQDGAEQAADHQVGQLQHQHVRATGDEVGGVDAAEGGVQRGQHVEDAQQHQHRERRTTGGPAVGVGVEPHDHVRQAHRAEERRDDEGVRRVEPDAAAGRGQRDRPRRRRGCGGRVGRAVRRPHREQDEDRDQQRGQLHPEVEGLHEGDRPHPARAHRRQHDQRDDERAGPRRRTDRGRAA